MARVVEWDGKNVPAAMRSLPPGRYVLEPVDETIALTPDEESGLEKAIAGVDAGEPGVTAAEVRRSFRSARKR
jgi:hypothetical protein